MVRWSGLQASCPSTAGATGSIPGWWTKIPNVAQPRNKWTKKFVFYYTLKKKRTGEYEILCNKGQGRRHTLCFVCSWIFYKNNYLKLVIYLGIRGRRRVLGPAWGRQLVQCSSQPLQPSGPLLRLKWTPDTNLTRGTQRTGARVATKYLACQDYTEPTWFWLESARHPGVWGLSSCAWRTYHTSVEDGGETQKVSGARAWCASDFPRFRPPFLCCRNIQILICGVWRSRAQTWVWPLIVLFISWVIFRTITDDQYWNQTDYILCSWRWRSSIQSAKMRPAADCGSDHELWIAKFRVKLKKLRETTRPFRYDLNQIPYHYTVEVRNRLSGWYLVDRVPEKLWMEVCNMVQEVVTKPSQEK